MSAPCVSRFVCPKCGVTDAYETVHEAPGGKPDPFDWHLPTAEEVSALWTQGSTWTAAEEIGAGDVFEIRRVKPDLFPAYEVRRRR